MYSDRWTRNVTLLETKTPNVVYYGGWHRFSPLHFLSLSRREGAIKAAMSNPRPPRRAGAGAGTGQQLAAVEDVTCGSAFICVRQRQSPVGHCRRQSFFIYCT